MWGRALALQDVGSGSGLQDVGQGFSPARCRAGARASTRWHGGRVRTYWIVDPVNEAIEVHRLEAGGYRLAQRASGEDEVR
jgi:hypothetical protein